MSSPASLGFGPFFTRQLSADERRVPARTAARHRSGDEVWTAGGGDARAAVEAGTRDPDRLEHFQKLQRAWQLRHDEPVRRRAERAFGQLADEAKLARKFKGRL